MDHVAILELIVAWASQEDDIRLAVLTGSVARGEDQFDPLSDLDIELYVTTPRLLLERNEWYERFGSVLVTEELENPGWHPTRLVYYADGKIDFMIGEAGVARAGIGYEEPYRILVDKDDLTGGLRRDDSQTLPPSQSEFLRSINWFYAAALMEAKCIVRQELWMASVRDRDLKDELLQMVEWDHRARHGWDGEAWDSRRHLRQWIDGDVFGGLVVCWAGFTSKAMTQALRSSVVLFDTVATRAASALGIDVFDGRAVQEEIERIIASSSERRR